jgi:hypothetical protein
VIIPAAYSYVDRFRVFIEKDVYGFFNRNS